MLMWTVEFWRDAAVRAVKTFAQALAALLVADGTDLLATAWTDRLSVAGMAALVSLLTTVASGATTGSPAAGEAVTPDQQVAAYDDGHGLKAGPASPIPDGSAVEVTREGTRPRE